MRKTLLFLGSLLLLVSVSHAIIPKYITEIYNPYTTTYDFVNRNDTSTIVYAEEVCFPDGSCQITSGGGSGGPSGQINLANQYSSAYYFVAGSSNVISGLAPGTSGQILTTGGPTGPPFWSILSTGGSGIVSPGTFTWTNNFGILLSTAVVSSTFTLNGELLAGGGAGNVGQVLVSNGPGAAPTFVDPVVSQANPALLNATVYQSTASLLNATVSINPSSNTVTVSGSVFVATVSVSINGSSNTVIANQGTNPWITSGTISNFPTSQTINGTITANQGTNPWITSGTITSGSITVTNTGFNVNNSPTVFLSTVQVVASTVGAIVQVNGSSVTAANPFPITGSITANFTPPALTTVTFNGAAQPVSQSGAPWSTTISGTPTVFLSTVQVVASTVGAIVQVNGSSVTAANPFPITGSINANFTPPALTTVTFNGAAQPVSQSGAPWSTTISGNPTVFLSTVQVVASTVGAIVQVNGSSVTAANPFPITGSITANFTPPALTTVTFNGSAQPVTQSGTWNVGLNSGTNNIGTVTGSTVTIFTSGGSNLPVTFSNTSIQANQGTAGANGWPVILSTSGVNASTVTAVIFGTPNFNISNNVTLNALPTGTNNIGTVSGSSVTVFTSAGVNFPVSVNNSPTISNTGFNVNNSPTVNPGNVLNTSGWLVQLSSPLPTGTNNIGTVSGSSVTIFPSNGMSLSVISTSTIVSGNTSTGTIVVTNKPVITGGIAYNAVPSTVTSNGAAVNSYYSPDGAQVTDLDCSRQNLVKSSITISGSTTETVILSSGATGVYDDLVEILALNTSGTATRVDFRSGGNTTNIDFALYIPAGDQRGATLPHRWPQTLAATNWTAQSSASITDLRIYALYCKSQ